VVVVAVVVVYGERREERERESKKWQKTKQHRALARARLLNAKQLSCDKGRTAAPRRGERILGSACSSRSAGDE